MKRLKSRETQSMKPKLQASTREDDKCVLIITVRRPASDQSASFIVCEEPNPTESVLWYIYTRDTTREKTDALHDLQEDPPPLSSSSSSSSYVPPLWLARVTVSNGLNSLQLRPSSQHDPQTMCNLDYSPKSLQPRPIFRLLLLLLLLLMGPNKDPLSPHTPPIPVEEKKQGQKYFSKSHGKRLKKKKPPAPHGLVFFIWTLSCDKTGIKSRPVAASQRFYTPS